MSFMLPDREQVRWVPPVGGTRESVSSRTSFEKREFDARRMGQDKAGGRGIYFVPFF